MRPSSWLVIAPTTQTFNNSPLQKQKKYSPPTYVGHNLYIKPSYVVSIPEFFREGAAPSARQIENLKNLENNQPNPLLSRKAITGLRNAINWLCLAAQRKRVYVRKTAKTFSFKVNFVTLTLPDTTAPIGARELQAKLLGPLLVYLRKYCQLKNYVWRLEYQKNGKLHVHLTTDTFLHHRTLRDSWNRLLRKNGYMHEFTAKHGHSNPNSTDVHATKSVRDLAAYLAKYMAKSDQATQALQGRIWGCNYELSRASKCSVNASPHEAAAAHAPLMRSCIAYKPIEIIPPRDEWYEFYPNNPKYAPRKIGEIYFPTARDWIHNIWGPVKEAFENTRIMIASLARHYTIEEL